MESRIGWISIANDSFGSTRIGVTNIHKALVNRGIFSMILNYNKKFHTDIDKDYVELKNEILQNRLTCVVFHKVCGPKAVKLAEFCVDQNINCVYCNGDWHENQMYDIADQIIVGSPYIKEILDERYNVKGIHYIDDALEFLGDIKIHFDVPEINMCWYGNFTKLEYARDYINSLELPDNYKLTTVSNAPCEYTNLEADITMGAATGKPWDTLKLSKYILEEVDIVVVPIDLSDGDPRKTFAKTANRITFAMSLGVPVVATPIPTYQLVIQDKFNGYLCQYKEQWQEALTELGSAKKRNRISGISIDDIRTKYDINNIIKKWIPILCLED